MSAKRNDDVRSLLARGIVAAKAGDKGEARRYLEWALRRDPMGKQRIKTWFWLSEISDDPAEKRHYLDLVLSTEPNYQPARRSLAVLDGHLDPDAIVNPDRLPFIPSQGSGPVDARRFICPQCGGQRTFTPAGISLTCERCDQRRELVLQGHSHGKSRKTQDFTIAMATMQGHIHPTGERSFVCPACGAPSMLDSDDLSVICPYCDSVYVIDNVENENLVSPDEIIPFALTANEALRSLRDWLIARRIRVESQKISLRGFYLPAWMFSISSYAHNSSAGRLKKSWRGKSGCRKDICYDILVPASRALPDEWEEEVNHFQLDQLVPFDAAYLADWPAETYQISLSDASLTARLQALKRIREIDPQDTSLTSMDLMIESFKLVLLPFWSAGFVIQKKHCPAIINGQTGRVRLPNAPDGLVGRLSSLLGLDSPESSTE